MALFATPWQFANETDCMTGTLDITQGIDVTLGANNADGSAVTLISAVGHDIHWLVFAFCGDAATAAINPCKMVDILQDPAGGTSWSDLISDLILIANPVIENVRHQAGYSFPLYVPAGTSIGIQGRSAHTATRVIRALCWAFGNPSRPDQWWCGSKVETLGATPAGSRGTTVTPGTSGAYGSWTNIGSTTGGRYGYIQPGYCGENTAASMQNQANLLQIGYSSTKLPGSPTWFLGGGIDEAGSMDLHGMPCWCDIPEGTQMQAHIAADLAATPDPLEIALYGVY